MASSDYTDAIMLFGDSLTETWAPGSFGQRMAEYYSRKCDVIVRGFGGYNTQWAIPVLKQVLSTTAARKDGHAQNVKVISIWFGANDSVMPAEYQHIPIDEYKSNLSKLISVLRSPESAYHCPDTKIIMITPPPIMEKAHFEDTKASRKADGTLVEPMSPTRRYEHSKQYSVACYDFAKEESLPVVDIHTAIIRAAGGETEEQLKPYFLDGVHLTSAGYEVLFRKFTEVLIETSPELNPELMKHRVPEYTDFKRKPDLAVGEINKQQELREKGQL